jgi:putative PIN family toxin of toxin-antitoxin system
LLEEFLEVASRPKFRKFFRQVDIAAIFSQIEGFSELIVVKSKVDKCRDLNDNFLLNLAIDGKADFLVTGDSDLLVLGRINQTQILSWADFVSMQ